MFEYSGEAIFVQKGLSGFQGEDDKVSVSVTVGSAAQDII